MTDLPVPRPRGTLANITARIEADPRRTFVFFLLCHGLLWSALPALFFPNLPLDIVEALIYGREWQFGYDKLPPLPWWLVELAYRAVGLDIAYYALSQIVVLAAFALVFATALPIVGGVGALVALLIVDGLHYFNFTAPKFNHDVMQLPFWALAGFAFHRALSTGRLLFWVLLGLALGGAFWSKYFVVILAAPLAAYLVFDAQGRRALLTPGPYVAALVALIVAAPHLLWLVQNDFLPLRYAEARAVTARGALGHLVYPLFFAGAQLAWLLPSLLIAAALFLKRDTNDPATPTQTDLRIVSLLAFGPFAFVIAASAITGRGLITMWGYPLWLFAGLWCVLIARQAITRERIGAIAATWAATTAVYALVFVLQYAVLPHFDKRYRASLFPGAGIAERLTAGFQTATGAKPHYIVSSMWLGGNISHYAPGVRPRVVIDGKPARAPWIDLADLKKRGAIVAWMDSDPAVMPQAFAQIAAGAELQPPLTVPLRWKKGEITIGWAILRPQP
jgi:4-amino-4-deoxy-L-arabinose transferase-like glycosyltransferase